MLAVTESIVEQARGLPPEERVEIIRAVMATLIETPKPNPAPQGRMIRFGQYYNPERWSTEEDFKLAEWNPTDEEIDKKYNGE